MPRRDSRRRSEQAPSADSTRSSDPGHAHPLVTAATVERELWLVVVGAMLIDVTLTVHGRQIGLVERNPVARLSIDAFGVLGLYGLKIVALGLGGACRLAVPDRYGPVVPIGLAIPSLLAIGVNAIAIAIVQF